MLFSWKLSLCVVCVNLLTNVSSRRIIGGRPAKEGEFPYQVSLRRSYNDDHFCGGTIITPLHILTAGHCMFYRWGGLRPPTVVSVVVGQLDLPVTETSIYRNASKITVHEDMDLLTLANDIAVIELDKELPIESNKLIDIVAMRETSISSGKCVVSGWGYEEHESGIISQVLLAAEVDIIEFSICKQLYAKEDMELSEGMLCAGHELGGKDACQGDSGGPLVCDGLLTAVVSTGNGCGEAAFPGIYSDVAKYLPWIMKNIAISTTTSTSSSTSFTTTSEVTTSATTDSTEFSTTPLTSSITIIADERYITTTESGVTNLGISKFALLSVFVLSVRKLLIFSSNLYFCI